MLLVYLTVAIYGVYKWIINFNNLPDAANVLMAVNFISLVTLIIAELHKRKIEIGLDRELEFDQEDFHLFQLERKAYAMTIYTEIAVCLSFITMLVGFLLFRDDYPEVPFASVVLLAVAFIKSVPSEKILNLTNPGFTFPNPKSKNFNKELLDQFDDGQKHLMFQGLYKLYQFTIWALVLLSFGLMFYSAFTGNSQLVSIVCIGILLMIIQVGFIISTKPNNLKETGDV
ncbi:MULTISPECIES: DUF3169 family protein [unclassified Lysinibacillus]|uniref:DUF3169 family protein n=1 Tax=unclassified Lysinibacillus TaxID=2636778 RepID=UPI002010D859|nr:MULTISPECIES: DUF3169 family protein [unclassified Lysinibacillus]MCL1696900.1 DUF3169 family protein [Lysinibacillus sp. BPa_S21]MCL1701559.1 DUF3169 family protein [Lysinibacillus sp. Bpr_S20]